MDENDDVKKADDLIDDKKSVVNNEKIELTNSENKNNISLNLDNEEDDDDDFFDDFFDS